MHRECLTPAARRVLKALAPLAAERVFVLAGGTAAALHLGHRLSVDLDFFTERSFPTSRLLREVRDLGFPTEVLQEEPGTLTLSISGVKVSFFQYPHPFAGSLSVFGGVRVAGLIDIAAMKLIAIAQRGAKRDFVDLYFILREVPFPRIAENMVERFGADRVSPVVIGKALVFFADADDDPEPRYLEKAVAWKDIKKYLAGHVKQYTLDLHQCLSGR